MKKATKPSRLGTEIEDMSAKSVINNVRMVLKSCLIDKKFVGESKKSLVYVGRREV